jgi:hypothetical protein
MVNERSHELENVFKTGAFNPLNCEPRLAKFFKASIYYSDKKEIL